MADSIGYAEFTDWADLSVDKALVDAVNNLPDFDPPHPDFQWEIKVVELGVQSGGFAGVQQTYVRVEDNQP